MIIVIEGIIKDRPEYEDTKIQTEEEQKESLAQHLYQQNPGFNIQLYDPKIAIVNAS